MDLVLKRAKVGFSWNKIRMNLIHLFFNGFYIFLPWNALILMYNTVHKLGTHVMLFKNFVLLLWLIHWFNMLLNLSSFHDFEKIESIYCSFEGFSKQLLQKNHRLIQSKICSPKEAFTFISLTTYIYVYLSKDFLNYFILNTMQGVLFFN
jgi:hypothetical protein